MMMTA
jgi:hypothetical protein